MTQVSPIVRRLQYQVPEINDSLDSSIKSWEEASRGARPTDDHIFGSFLAPYTAQLLREEEDQTETLGKIFGFLEEALQDPSEWVRSLVEVSFCEQFAEERDVLEKAFLTMGPRLRQSIYELGR